MTNSRNQPSDERQAHLPFESIKVGVIGRYSWKALDQRWMHHLEKFDALDDEDLRAKETCALYGLATYMACVFESGLKNVVAYSEAFRGKCPSIHKTQKELEKKTMGALIRRLKKSIDLDSHSEQLIRVALRKRNYLAHCFWERRAHHSYSPVGRKRMVIELVRSCQLFETADFVLEPAMQTYLKEIAKMKGITYEEVQEELNRVAEEMKNAPH